MRKILFNDKYGLTEAVLEGRKTMTRRIVPSQYVPMIEDGLQGAALIEAQRHGDAFREGEVVAVAQAYKDLDYSLRGFATNPDRTCGIRHEYAKKQAGWNNKMFVSAKFMPHQIQITDIKLERLQDISDEDCLREGVLRREIKPFNTIEIKYQVPKTTIYKDTPRAAFASLIDKVSGKGTWDSNPWVFVYEFKLVK